MTEMTEDECTFWEELKKESQMLVPNRERTKQALIRELSRASVYTWEPLWNMETGTVNVSLTLFYILLVNTF